MKNTRRLYVSEKLAILNEAAAKFWVNAVPHEPDTHPKNVQVIVWLMALGWPLRLATAAATIIRPEWAQTGWGKGRPGR